MLKLFAFWSGKPSKSRGSGIYLKYSGVLLAKYVSCYYVGVRKINVLAKGFNCVIEILISKINLNLKG